MRYGFENSRAGRLAERAIYIPKHARLVEGPSGGAAYAYDEPNNPRGPRYGVVAFWGTAGKPTFNYVYRSAEARDKKIAEFHTNIKGHAERKAKSAAEKAAWKNPLKVGDVLYTSWGYDQTNVDFFAVTKVSGKRVHVREVAGEMVPDEGVGPMSGRTRVKLPLEYVGPETMHTAQPSGERGAAIKINESATAWLEAEPGKSTHYTSWYH